MHIKPLRLEKDVELEASAYLSPPCLLVPAVQIGFASAQKTVLLRTFICAAHRGPQSAAVRKVTALAVHLGLRHRPMMTHKARRFTPKLQYSTFKKKVSYLCPGRMSASCCPSPSPPMRTA